MARAMERAALDRWHRWHRCHRWQSVLCFSARPAKTSSSQDDLGFVGIETFCGGVELVGEVALEREEVPFEQVPAEDGDAIADGWPEQQRGPHQAG